jgi:predicted permease
VPHTIVGVLPTDFEFPRREELGALTQLGDRTEIFKPLPAVESAWAGDYDYIVLGRRQNGQSTAAVQSDLDRLETGIVADQGLSAGLKTTVQPLTEVLVAPVRRGLLALLAAVVVLLLIACVNLASLVLARVLGRRRELAIRLALGAPRSGVLAGTLAESFLVAACGGGLGVAGAWAVLRAVGPHLLDLPRLTAVSLNGRAVGVAMMATLATGMLAGLLPLRQMTRRQRGRFEVDGGRNSSSQESHRLRELLVGGQVALACWLLVVAAMVAGSVLQLLRIDRGFGADQALVASVRIPAEQRDTPLFDHVLERLRSLPGVRSTALVSRAPLTGESQVNGVQLEGSDVDAIDPTSRARVEINVRYASPGYFETMGIPLLDGRALRPTDRGQSVAVVSQRMAALLWPGRDPLGKRFRTGSRVGKVVVVGVVKDVYNGRLDEPATLVAYVPYWDRHMTLADVIVAASGPTRTVLPMVRDTIEHSAAGVAIPRLRTMEQIVETSLSQRRLASTLTVGFALTALLLSSLGIYGVVTHGVMARRREIGVRIALGSSVRQVVSLVLGRGLRPVLGGMAVGLCLGFVGSRFLHSLVFGFSDLQAPAIVGAALVLGLATVAACLAPALSAARTDPVKVLRAD